MKLPLALFAATALPALALRADQPPASLGRGLRELLAAHEAQPSSSAAPAERKARLAARFPMAARSVVVDGAAARVIVDVKLDGTQPLASVRAGFEALGATVSATVEAPGAGSLFTARAPLDRLRQATAIAGVQSILLVHRPIRRIGKATSQGDAILHSDALNARGYDGRGITVGVLSDSYDIVSPHAAADIASGDLPGAGNPEGHTAPVYVIADGASDSTDEGRAMLQIVHDVAPAARLAFAASGDSQLTFADHIRALRTDPNASCDVLVDDISFPDEPFFSDGPVAQAVDQVVNSDALNGKRALFYSAAGNDGGAAWADDFRPVTDAAARAGLPKNNLKLDQVPAGLTDGGFHNFDNRAGKVQIAQQVTVSADTATVCLQWDDLSTSVGKKRTTEPNLLTTDYNVLVFDKAGNYLTDLDGGTDKNLDVPGVSKGTAEALEIFDLDAGKNGGDRGYQFAISRRNLGTQQAVHLRYVASTQGTFQANFVGYATPSIYGHSAARGVDAVAAYDYSALAQPEPFTSLGPVAIYFDGDGNRLAAPEIRQQPTIAAPDNVNTTFFPGADADTDDDNLPNFSGTSASAPSAAGVAAILLQAAGGPGKLTALQARALLESTAREHDLDPFFARAIVTTSEGSIATLQAVGDSSNNSASDPKFFKLTFDDGAGRTLHKATINLAPAGLKFDPSEDLGFPFTVGKGNGIGAGIVANFSADGAVLNLKFPEGQLLPGLTIEFGADRDDAKTMAGGNSADLLAGAIFKIKTKDADGTSVKAAGQFVNDRGAGYSPVDGFGLIDAEAAVNKLLVGQ